MLWGSLVSQALSMLMGVAGSAVGEKGYGVRGPHSVTIWSAIIGRVIQLKCNHGVL